MKNKTVLFSVLAVFALFAVIAVPSVSATYPANAIYLEPEDSSGLYCENSTLVEVRVNASVVTTGVQTDIYFDPTCVNITDVDYTGSAWPPLAPPGWTHWGDHVTLIGIFMAGVPAGDNLFATIRLHCVNEGCCISDLEFHDDIVLDSTPAPIDITAYDGMFTCEIPEKPDLVVGKGVEIGPDGKFIVSYTVTNIGGGDAGESKTCKYVDSVLQETQDCPALAPDESYSDAFAPEECPCDAVINVTVCADNADVVNESDETNNCEVNFVDCPLCKPDLVVGKGVEIGPEGKFIVSYTVTNIGGAPAGESKTCKYVDSVLQETQDCPALAPDESYSDAFAPEECPCDAVINVTVCADNEDVVNESDEGNNCEVNEVECPLCKPDLNVTEITVNYDASSLGGRAIGPEPGSGVHTECNNLSAVIGECNGVDVGAPFDVTFEVDGTTLCTVNVPSLTGGSTKTVYCNCSWYPYAGDVFAIKVTADSNHEIPETNETNNTKWNNGTAVSNGYKGDGWQGPDKNLENVQCHDQDTINLIYSVGDSEYVSGSTQWTEYAGSWSTDDLPVPDGAEIEKAMLYVYYTWDKDTVMPNNVNMAFNGNNIALARDYSDSKGFGDYDFPSGMLVYNVLNNFAATGPNNAILTKAAAADVVSMRGMLLMVVYKHPDEPERMICIDEGYDMLYAKDSYAVTSEEATTYAPFTCCEPVPVEELVKATLIAVAPSASDGDDMNRLSFNDGLWQGIWDHYEAATQLGIAEADVFAYLKPAENRANFQSHIPAGGDKGDFMDASNAFLILEKKPKPDLTVTEITVNYDASSLGGRAIGPEPGDDVYTECNNLSAVIEEENGVDVESPFDVTFEIDETTLCTVLVPGLTGGANKTVYCNCSWYPYAGDVFAIKVTADSNHEIPETNETNNTKWNNGTAVSNGYKGDGWQGPDKNLENVQCHDQDTINLIYSVGDSEYVSGSTQWTEYAGSWSTDDLPVPDGAEIEKAMLYVYYTWDKDTVMPNNVNMAFNGNNIALARDYSDSKGFGDYDFPSGMLVYNVLNNFAATGPNNAILTKAAAADVVSMRGMLLMVVYKHPDEPERMICIDEGYDMLYAKDSYAVTSEEATTYAPFTCCEPVPVEELVKATLIAVAPSASDGDDMNRLSFNDGLWQGIWDHYEAATQLGIAEADVFAYLKPAENRANFQSHIPAGGDKGDFMDASNAFLILEKEVPCPAKYAVYQAKVIDPEGRLNELRALRDNKLDDGYVTRYYEYSPMLTLVLSRADSDLVKDGAQLLSRYSIPVGLHVQGMDVNERITRQDVEEALSFTDRLKSEVMKNRDAIGVKSTEAIIVFIDEFEGQVKASEGKTFSAALKSSIYYEGGQLRVDQEIEEK